MVVLPEATRSPPTLSTAMNATWMARPAVLPAMALHVAACTLARHASVAAASSRSPSRSSAPDALTVRNAPNMRSSAAPITPTDSCARFDARLMRGTTTPMTTTASPSAARVTASMTGSSSAISTMVAPSVRNAGDPADQGADGHLAQQRGVRGHPRHEVAGLVPLDRRQAQPQQPGQQAATRFQDHGLRRAPQDVAADRTDGGVRDHQHRHQRHQAGDGPVGAEGADQLADHQRQCEPGGRGGQAEQTAERPTCPSAGARSPAAPATWPPSVREQRPPPHPSGQPTFPCLADPEGPQTLR